MLIPSRANAALLVYEQTINQPRIINQPLIVCLRIVCLGSVVFRYRTDVRRNRGLIANSNACLVNGQTT